MKIIESARRQLQGQLQAWVQSKLEPDTELAVLFREKASFPFMVVMYLRVQDSFPSRRSFKTWTEAWTNFSAMAELYHFNEDGPSHAVP